MPSVPVTGAGRGIGKSIAQYLAGRGWDVVAGVRCEADATAVNALYPQRISSVEKTRAALTAGQRELNARHFAGFRKTIPLSQR
jgi:NAD(P)-dependent dehydrogenase (short-subunit alcohol dehydrogenase family)